LIASSFVHASERAMPALADLGIIHINGGRIGTQSIGVVVDAPATLGVEVAVAGLHIRYVPNLSSVLPDRDVSTSREPRAHIAGLHMRPLPHGNAGVRRSRLRVAVSSIDEGRGQRFRYICPPTLATPRLNMGSFFP